LLTKVDPCLVGVSVHHQLWQSQGLGLPASRLLTPVPWVLLQPLLASSVLKSHWSTQRQVASVAVGQQRWGEVEDLLSGLQRAVEL